MIRLKKATINKYKSFYKKQEIDIDNSITALVGKNESGKTAFLEALAKFNYFKDDPDYKINEILDYPRNELKKMQQFGLTPEVLKCTFMISDNLIIEIENDVGKDIFSAKEFEISLNYKGTLSWHMLPVDESRFLSNYLKNFTISEESAKIAKNIKSLKNFIEQDFKEDEILIKIKEEITNKYINKSYKDWDTKLWGYIVRNYLSPNLPRFWYYDEYYSLPSRINMRKVKENIIDNELSAEEIKTSKALFELAGINIDDLLKATNFETFLAELEATSNSISDDIFKYWKTNTGLEIKFEIDQVKKSGYQEMDKILDLRIRSTRHRVSLPLRNRSSGFNWFFSFIVWFSKIQSDTKSTFILLLDEPGLNLHASAQADLLKYIEDLSEKYQIIYTTHSPFMIDSNHLERIRTVVDSKEGSIVTDALYEKDEDTLFPLQAALGYNLAQNLFIGKNNLIVEGPSDLIYLFKISQILIQDNKQGLREDITIVPVGGLDKVATFIALLKGQKLNITCLLDSFRDTRSQQRLQNLISAKIIKESNVRFYSEFANKKKADVEDMFENVEYLKMYNEAFDTNISVTDLDLNLSYITEQILKFENRKQFNHYHVANNFLRKNVDKSFFSANTLNKFEDLFKEINKSF